MVRLIENLAARKEYNLETIYLAVNIADRYLHGLSTRGKPDPNFVLLAMTALMLAAKANEAVKPAYQVTSSLLPDNLKEHVSKSEFIALESRILTRLQFDLKYCSPIFFLERFQRLFGLDVEQKDSLASMVGCMSRNMCLLMLREAHFLNYKPSQIASASIMLALNLVNNRVNNSAISITAQNLRDSGLMNQQ